MRRYFHSFPSNDHGTSAIEFAIVAPVFLTILLAVFAYGIYFGAVSSTAQLAADAARASVAGLSDAERVQLAQAHVATTAKAYPLLNPAKLTVEAGQLAGDPSQFQISVKYDASSLPIWSFIKFLPLPDKQIIRTATIRKGGG